MRNCYRLCCECFVCLNQVEVADFVAGFLHYLAGCCNRSDTHNAGFYACQLACYPGSHRLYAQLLCLFFAHNDQRCRCIVDTGRIAGGYDTTLFECRTQLADALCRYIRSGSLISIKYNGLFFLFYFHRNDLVLELALCNRFLCLLLAPCCKLIQLLSGQSPVFCNIFSSNTHMIAAECIRQGIADQRIIHLSSAHSVTESCIVQKIRSHGHIFHTASYDDIRITGGNQLGSQVYTVHAGAAQYVDRSCRNLYRNPCVDGCLSCRILAKTCLNDTAHIYFIYLLRFDSGSFQGFFDYNSAQIRCGSFGKSSSHYADCCSACACQHYFSCHNNDSSIFPFFFIILLLKRFSSPLHALLWSFLETKA